MGWLKKIFKGSTHGTCEGQYRGKYEVDVVWNEPSKASEGPSKYKDEDEDEDLDHAIAVSLSEEERKGKAIDKKPQLEEDEQLARALHESLNPNYRFNGIGQIYRPSASFLSTFRCAGCHREITDGCFLSCMGTIWHPECFRCYGCNNPISNNEFSVHGNRPYHTSCYRELRQPKCDVCKLFIPSNLFGLIEYKAHPFWQQKYCPSHDYDHTPRCCSCERMEPRDMKYITLDDGRKLCLECLDSAIMDTNECQPLFQFIKEFYEGLNMKIEQQIPLLLVERQALNEAMESERNGTHHLPETRGLCLAEEQIVSVISRRPTIGPGNMITNILTRPYRLVRLCEVTAILILYGLPRYSAILCHSLFIIIISIVV
ncbi:Protein DA1-like protein [Dioscorea alata]|uniref:Protein DA1-like protein n=1 Tax=Dioscorea alata TaxID=55571 RepID=A0ACB7UKJ7_DIOAL|nr:Protein DA1-like protein [Dioscorea alata]